MKTALMLLVSSVLVLSLIPAVFATEVGIGTGVVVNPTQFEPMVWMCDHRVVFDDNTEPGRLPGQPLLERLNNYAFEGEQIGWTVLVLDKNGIEKINDVYATVGPSQGPGNPIEVNCDFQRTATSVLPECNARIGQELLTGNQAQVAGYWDCLLTVETADSMYGEHWVTVEAEDNTGLLGTMAENEYWFLNPIIALSMDGDLTFDEVTPGTSSYSDTLLIGNDADEGSGVLMDMFISGTDFYDSASSGAMCPTTNQLRLGDGDSYCNVSREFGGTDPTTDPFCYFATSGAYSTLQDPRNDREGYVGIDYGIGFNNPEPFYDGFEIIQGPRLRGSPYYLGNVLTPGAEHALTFRLNLPEPCNGNFDTGSIFFWGEAI